MNSYQVLTRAEIEEAARAIAGQTAHHPQIGLVLGSGLNALAEQVADADHIAYSQIPHFAVTSVPGHVGKAVIGRLENQDVLILQGRVHGYEVVWPHLVTFPIRVMHALGIHTLIVTNAAGGVNPAFRAGDLMLIVDHLGLAAMAGNNPLYGPNEELLGPRFVDMSKAYDPVLRRLALDVAQRLDIDLKQGIYAGLAGPTFETPAEVRFLRTIGVDAVGMSTVPEVIVARHMGMRVLGISGISNVAISDPDAEGEANHEEVLAMGQAMVPKLTALLRGVLAGLPTP
jgi:purine-nucleoside phosphorylase